MFFVLLLNKRLFDDLIIILCLESMLKVAVCSIKWYLVARLLIANN